MLRNLPEARQDIPGVKKYNELIGEKIMKEDIGKQLLQKLESFSSTTTDFSKFTQFASRSASNGLTEGEVRADERAKVLVEIAKAQENSVKLIALLKAQSQRQKTTIADLTGQLAAKGVTVANVQSTEPSKEDSELAALLDQHAQSVATSIPLSRGDHKENGPDGNTVTTGAALAAAAATTILSSNDGHKKDDTVPSQDLDANKQLSEARDAIAARDMEITEQKSTIDSNLATIAAKDAEIAEQKTFIDSTISALSDAFDGIKTKYERGIGLLFAVFVEEKAFQPQQVEAFLAGNDQAFSVEQTRKATLNNPKDDQKRQQDVNKALGFSSEDDALLAELEAELNGSTTNVPQSTAKGGSVTGKGTVAAAQGRGAARK